MKTIFIHIPKTGGTTLKEIFKKDYHPDDIYEDLSDFGTPDISRIKQKVIFGHICYHESYSGNNLITVLRNPINRIISHYGHVLGNDHPSKPFAEKGLADYAGNPHHKQLDNGMIRQITNTMHLPFGSIGSSHLADALSALGEFTAVGILENFDEFIDRLFAKGIIKQREYESMNIGRINPEDVLTSESMDAIISNNNYDIKLYNFMMKNK